MFLVHISSIIWIGWVVISFTVLMCWLLITGFYCVLCGSSFVNKSPPDYIRAASSTIDSYPTGETDPLDPRPTGTRSTTRTLSSHTQTSDRGVRILPNGKVKLFFWFFFKI